MKAKNLASAFIIGHSMGGMIAQQFAINYPALTRAVVIIDSDANFKDNPGFPEFYNTVLKMQGAFDRSFMEEFQRSTIFKPIDAAYFKKLVDESMKVPLQVFKAACTGLANSDLSVKIQQIKVPAMIMWGDKDNVCSMLDQQAMAKKIRHSKLIVYENTGHALHWENPDRFTRDLHLFILQCSKKTR
jgi:pimeloyl-ACP methyl ester carboxylesterase